MLNFIHVHDLNFAFHVFNSAHWSCMKFWTNMPIITKDYTYTQNSETLYIQVPLKGVQASKADIYCKWLFYYYFTLNLFKYFIANDLYIKINFPPFFFHLDLLYPVNSDSSAAHVGNGVVKFELAKVLSYFDFWRTEYILYSTSQLSGQVFSLHHWINVS